MLEGFPLTHADLQPLLERISRLESTIRGRDRDIEDLEKRIEAIEASPTAIVPKPGEKALRDLID